MNIPTSPRFGAIYTFKPFDREAALANPAIQQAAQAKAEYLGAAYVATLPERDTDRFLRSAWSDAEMAQVKQQSPKANHHSRYGHLGWNQQSVEQQSQCYASDAGHQEFDSAYLSLYMAYHTPTGQRGHWRNPVTGTFKERKYTLENKKKMVQWATHGLFNIAAKLKDSTGNNPQLKLVQLLANLPSVENGVTPEVDTIIQQLSEIPFEFPLDRI